MILIGLGANLPTDTYGPPRAALGAALQAIEEQGGRVKQRASWYESAPVPISEQPWYVNGVAEIETALSAVDVIGQLLALENRFGRIRTIQNAPRILDLDLLAYHDQVITGANRTELTLPHPRMYERAFVILPLREIASTWSDPVSGRTIDELANALPQDQQAHKMSDAGGLFGTEWESD